MIYDDIPSGKRLRSYRKSPLLMGKSTISMAIFNSKLLTYQRVSIEILAGIPAAPTLVGDTECHRAIGAPSTGSPSWADSVFQLSGVATVATVASDPWFLHGFSMG